MPLTFKVNAGAGDFEPVPAGSHIAVCDILADLGLQPGSGIYPQPKNQIYIRFEIPNERIQFEKDGKKQEGPAVIGITCTASMNEKAKLRHHLESWRGKAFTDEEAESFDVSSVLGKPCMLTVMHTKKGDRTYANITGIGPLPKGIKSTYIKAELPLILYAEPDNTMMFQSLPEWLRKKIESRIIPEKRQEPIEESPKGNQLDDGSFIDDSDIPF